MKQTTSCVHTFYALPMQFLIDAELPTEQLARDIEPWRRDLSTPMIIEV